MPVAGAILAAGVAGLGADAMKVLAKQSLRRSMDQWPKIRFVE